MNFGNPPARTGHVSVSWEDCIFIWGGYREGFTNLNLDGKEIWFYNCVYEKWMKIIVQGFSPICMSGCAAAVLNDSIYLFGGYGDEGTSNKLYRFDLKALEWEIVNYRGTGPMATDKLVGWHHSKKFYIFGGFGPPDGLYAYTFNFVFHDGISRVWTNQFFEFDPEQNKWSIPESKGDLPSPRAAHAAAVLGDKVYIFGGRNAGTRLNDMHCLDMRTMKWRKIMQHTVVPSNSCPVGRSWHSLTPTNERYLVLFGGFSQTEDALSDCWLFDTVQESWLQLRLPFQKPRVWHSAALNIYNEVVVHGGCTSNILASRRPSQANDLFVIRVSPKSLFRLCIEDILKRPHHRFLWRYFPRVIQDILISRSENCPPNFAGS